MGQQHTKSKLFIKIILGETQSQELFDFQNGGMEQQQKIVKSPSFLTNKGETVEYIEEQNFQNGKQIIPQNAVYKITQDQFQQITLRDLGTQDNRALWRIIKSGQTHPLKPGDMLKIGKIKIQLKKIIQKKEQGMIEEETVKGQVEGHIADDLQSVRSNHSNCDRCRICFRSYNNKTDPLLCLCKCSGSIKYIHFLCLKDWISNSISKRQDQHCKFYTYQEMSCQLCKNTLPSQFQHQGKYYSFFEFTTFQPPYAEFQYSQIQNNKKKYYKYIINLSNDKQVLIGRNNSSQVVMKDISISRTHCSLQYRHGMLLVRDKKSKFGTLIKVTNSLQFNSQSGLMLQYDSKIIELYKKNTLKGCCCLDVDNYRLIYEGQKNRQGLQFQRATREVQLENGWQNQQTIQINGPFGSQYAGGFNILQNEEELLLIHEEQQQGEGDDNQMRRDTSARNTTIRQTIARDQAIRY